MTEAMCDGPSPSHELETVCSLEVGDMFSTLVEDACAEVLRIPQVSQELHEAITNMSDIADVENVLDDVMKSIRMDEVHIEELDCVEQDEEYNNSESGHTSCCKANEKCLSTSSFQPRQRVSKLEERLLRKDRIRKDKHNIVERRRRFHINDRIKELASLLPKYGLKALDKGSTLKATVEYIKEMKREKETLEANTRKLESKYKNVLMKMLTRICQLEVKMKWNEIKEEAGCMKSKKKKLDKRNSCAFESMVKDMTRNNILSKSDEQSATATNKSKPIFNAPQKISISTISDTSVFQGLYKDGTSDNLENRESIQISGNDVLSSLPGNFENCECACKIDFLQHCSKSSKDTGNKKTYSKINKYADTSTSKVKDHDFHVDDYLRLKKFDNSKVSFKRNVHVTLNESEADTCLTTSKFTPSKQKDKKTPDGHPYVTSNVLETLLRRPNGVISSSELYS